MLKWPTRVAFVIVSENCFSNAALSWAGRAVGVFSSAAFVALKPPSVAHPITIVRSSLFIESSAGYSHSRDTTRERESREQKIACGFPTLVRPRVVHTAPREERRARDLREIPGGLLSATHGVGVGVAGGPAGE